MEYKHNDYFKEILINEVIILASKNKKLIRIHHEDGTQECGRMKTSQKSI